MAEGDSWYEGLPESLRDAPFFKPGEDGAPREIDQVLNDINNAAAHMGNSIRIPGPDASPEQISEFTDKAAARFPDLMPRPQLDNAEAMGKLYDSLGRPAEAKEYKLPEIEGVDWSLKDMTALRDRAHQYGMSQGQFSSMVKDAVGDEARGTDIVDSELATAVAALKTEWGAAFQERVTGITGLLKATEAPGYLAEMLANDKLPPGDVKWLHSMVEAIGSEDFELGDHGPGTGVLTPDEALSQISEIEQRPDKALFTPSHPDHVRLAAKRVELMKLAYPGSGTSLDSMRA